MFVIIRDVSTSRGRSASSDSDSLPYRSLLPLSRSLQPTYPPTYPPTHTLTLVTRSSHSFTLIGSDRQRTPACHPLTRRLCVPASHVLCPSPATPPVTVPALSRPRHLPYTFCPKPSQESASPASIQVFMSFSRYVHVITPLFRTTPLCRTDNWTGSFWSHAPGLPPSVVVTAATLPLGRPVLLPSQRCYSGEP